MTVAVSVASGAFVLWIEYLKHRGARRTALLCVVLMLLGGTWAVLFTDFRAGADYTLLVALFMAWGIAWLAWGRRGPGDRGDPVE